MYDALYVAVHCSCVMDSCRVLCSVCQAGGGCGLMPAFSGKYSRNKAVRQRSDLLFIATSFWFEESPCAVRTKTAGLGRLCTLFVLSTLLVFEHMHAVLSSTLFLCRTMVTTNTAAVSNYRYADTDRVKNVFLIRFSKQHMDRTKAARWANATRIEGFTVASIKKDTNMRSLIIGDIEFTLNHVHYNLYIVHGVHLHLNTTCWLCL